MRCECKYPRGGGNTMHMLLGIPVVKCDVYFKLLAKSPNLSPSYFFPLYTVLCTNTMMCIAGIIGTFLMCTLRAKPNTYTIEETVRAFRDHRSTGVQLSTNTYVYMSESV